MSKKSHLWLTDWVSNSLKTLTNITKEHFLVNQEGSILDKLKKKIVVEWVSKGQTDS